MYCPPFLSPESTSLLYCTQSHVASSTLLLLLLLLLLFTFYLAAAVAARMTESLAKLLSMMCHRGNCIFQCTRTRTHQHTAGAILASPSPSPTLLSLLSPVRHTRRASTLDDCQAPLMMQTSTSSSSSSPFFPPIEYIHCGIAVDD